MDSLKLGSRCVGALNSQMRDLLHGDLYVIREC
jgi:hypothetical protein